MTSSDGDQNRRHFLQLLGASGASAGLAGQSQASDSRGDDNSPSVTLTTDEPNRCGPRRCEDVDYYIPVGSEIEFTASVSGSYALADIKLQNLDSGKVLFRDACTGPEEVSECETFTLSFDETGTYEIRYEAWNVGGATASTRGMTTASAMSCAEIDGLGCDTITCRVGKPRVLFNASRPSVEVGERTRFTAQLEPSLDDVEWSFDTYRVEDEEADSSGAAPGGENWFRRPLDTGQYVATATATIGEASFSAIERVTVESASKLQADEATITVDEDAVEGDLTLLNGSESERSAEVALRAFGDQETTLARSQITLGPEQGKKITLSGQTSEDVFVAVLELDGTTFMTDTLVDNR
jgi:hypothetical protein